MSPTLWSLLGGSIAILAEYLYRSLPGPWHAHWWLWVPLTVAISVCVWHIVNAPGVSLLQAFVVWTCATVALRVFVCLVLLRDPVSPGTWAALGLIVTARIIQQVWK